MSNFDTIIVRKAKLEDIDKLCNIYLGLSPHVRRWFHPFPFSKAKVKMIFLIMLISEKMLTIIKKTIPKLGFILLVAYDANNLQIVGFSYLRLIGREDGTLIANIGFTVKEGARNIGLIMYARSIEYAKAAGIGKFRIRTLEDNIVTIALTKRIGYRFKGCTTDEYWNGKYEKMLNWELDL